MKLGFMEWWMDAGSLKQRCTVLMISHNLGEVAPLVDHAWRMQMGGVLEPAPVPTTD